METIGADDEVERLLSPGRERHVDSVALVGDGGDVLVEAILDAVARPLVEQLAQIAAHDLDVPRHEERGKRRDGRTIAREQDELAGRGLVGVDRFPHLHPLKHFAVDGSAEVDGLPTDTQRRCTLDHRAP